MSGSPCSVIPDRAFVEDDPGHHLTVLGLGSRGRDIRTQIRRSATHVLPPQTGTVRFAYRSSSIPFMSRRDLPLFIIVALPFD